MKEIISRFLAESPTFFNKIIYWCIGLGAIGAGVLLTPGQYPDWLVSIADDLIKVGSTAALVASLTKKDKPAES